MLKPKSYGLVSAEQSRMFQVYWLAEVTTHGDHSACMLRLRLLYLVCND